MPLDKNQYERRQIIHTHLNTLLHFTWEQLAAQCAHILGEAKRPSMRTIREDIARLRDEGAPIPLRAAKYHYTHHYSLHGQHRSDEIALMREALGLLRQFEGLDMFEEVAKLQLKLADRLQQHESSNQQKVVQFEINRAYEGRTHLSALYKAIVEKQPLGIRYTDFQNRTFDFKLHPYLLKEYQNRWYLYGRNHAIPTQLLNLALDRIRVSEPIPIEFQANDCWDFSTYFTPVIGVTRYDTPTLQQPEEVRLRLHGITADYVLTKPLHPSQYLAEEADDWVEIELKVIVNRELISKILELGADCEVLTPISLRNQMRALAQCMLERYMIDEGNKST